MAKSIKVKYSKLGRERVWGFAHLGFDTIELDERIKGKKHLEIMLHEATHILSPEASEEETERISIALTNLVWGQGYRRIDNTNKEPLQNGRR